MVTRLLASLLLLGASLPAFGWPGAPPLGAVSAAQDAGEPTSTDLGGGETPAVNPGVADELPLASWLPTGLQGSVRELQTPASGAFFATTDAGFLRSNDGGDTWYAVSLPQGAKTAVVDPSNHMVLYAGGSDGLYVTRDDALTWNRLLPLVDEGLLRLAVSPVNPRLVYLALGGVSSRGNYRFLRSQDAGATWQELERGAYSLCAMTVPILRPHPADPARIFRAETCAAGRTTQIGLWHSRDQGATWQSAFLRSLEYADVLVGGEGVNPSRYYLAANRDPRAGGSTLVRSDDDAQSWEEILVHRGGGGLPRDGLPNVRLGGLAYDPRAPERVWVARTGDVHDVLASADSGTTWQSLGAEALGDARALALGIDARTLYLATDTGLWRLPLD